MITPLQRVAAVHDISCFGRGSLTTVIPVLSTMGVQACPLPTALLSTHTTDFTDYTFLDLTHEMKKIINHWKSLHLTFDAIYSGFLGSAEQQETVTAFIEQNRDSNPLVVVDPVLGDNGELLPTMDKKMVESMKELSSAARVITPNLTEAAFLLDESYRKNITRKELKQWLRRLTALGPDIAIITSVPAHGPAKLSCVAAYSKRNNDYWMVECGYIPADYPGTGDAFASVITASLLLGDSLPIALERATQFVTVAIRSTFGHNIPSRDGILLEKNLTYLHAPPTAGNCKIME